MNEREKVLLRREAVRRYIRDGRTYTLEANVEKEVRRLFPLPPEKVPNVEVGGDGWEYRQNPETGRMESRLTDDDGLTMFVRWVPWDEKTETAIRAVIAEPYRLVSGEDGE